MEFLGPIKTEPLEDTDDDVIIIEDDERDISYLEFKVKKEPTIDLVPKIKVEPSDPQVHQAKRARKSPLHVVILNENVSSQKCTIDNIASIEPAMIISSTAPVLQINRKQLTCSVCSEAFDHEYLLLTHNLFHRGWIYKCLHCSISFGQKEAFRLHLCMHSSGSSVYCPLCRRRFKSGFMLMVHNCLEDFYRCLVCRRVYLSFSSLMKHVMDHHI